MYHSRPRCWAVKKTQIPTGGCAGLDCEPNDMPPEYDKVNLKTGFSSKLEVFYPQIGGFNWSGIDARSQFSKAP